jgi:hypothetical protein
MTLSPEEIATKVMALPEPIQDQVLNFIEFKLEKTAKQTLIQTADSQPNAEIKQSAQLAGSDVMSSWTTDK